MSVAPPRAARVKMRAASAILASACLALSCASSLQAQTAAPAPPPAAAPPAAATAAGAGSLEALHNELRAVKDRALKAVNERNEEALLKELAPNILFTAMNNEKVRGIDETRAYYKRMMVGAGAIVKEMKLSAEADDLTTLHNGNNTGIVTGTSNAFFKLMSGLEFNVPLRWTATLVRNDNKWSIAGLHYSANMFDNPLLEAAGKGSRWLAIIGIPLALIGGYLLGRRSARA